MNELSIKQITKYICRNSFLIVETKVFKKLIPCIWKNLWAISFTLNLATKLLQYYLTLNTVLILSLFELKKTHHTCKFDDLKNSVVFCQ